MASALPYVEREEDLEKNGKLMIGEAAGQSIGMPVSSIRSA